MLTIDLSGIERMARKIEGASRQIPFLVAYSLTNAMKDAREAEYKEMRRAFDSPTAFTLNSLQVVPATKAKLTAELRFKLHGKLPAWKYLGPEVAGGPRGHKAFERALMARGLLQAGEYVVPGNNLQLDGNGNIPGRIFTQILSALGAQRDKLQNTTARSKRRRRTVNRSYFVMRNAGGQPGIYLRVGRIPVLVMPFVRAPTYRARYPYYQTANRVIPAAFRKHFREGWTKFIANGSR